MNYIFINKFDNYVKFKVFTKSADKKQNVTLDFASTGMSAKLSFIFDDDSKIYLDPVSDLVAANPGAGELLFRIDDTISTKLLNSKTRDYYIINQNEKGDEVLIYAGKFESQDKKTEIMAKINQNMIDELNATIAKLKKAQETINQPVVTTVASVAAVVAPAVTSSATPSPSTELLTKNQQTEAQIIDQATTFVTSATKGVDNAIKQAAADSTKETPIEKTLQIPEVPGVTPGLGAPITLRNQPKVIRPATPKNRGKFYQRLTEGAIKDIANNQSI
jgi:PHD/YefM family antitoxin component YafN of YafNO toxin-antitoxin module